MLGSLHNDDGDGNGNKNVKNALGLGSIHNLPRGRAMMILRGGVTLFPYYDLGGAVENFQRKLHRA